LELLARDLGTPGRRDLDQPLNLVIRQTRLNQSLQARKNKVGEEVAKIVGDLLAERFGGHRAVLSASRRMSSDTLI
jgi:hypothetical protein